MHTYTMHSLITNIQPPMAKRLNNSQSSISPGHHDGGPPSEGSTCCGTLGRSAGGGGGCLRLTPETAAKMPRGVKNRSK